MTGYSREFAAKVSNKMSSELLLRFSEESIEVLKGLDDLDTKSVKFLDEASLMKVVDYYGADKLKNKQNSSFIGG